MRKFLIALCFSLFGHVAVAADPAATDGLQAFRGPMEEIVGEAGKGEQQVDFDAVAKSYAELGKAWKQVLSEPLDLGRYGVPADKQDEVWRQVRLLGMLVGYLDEAIQRGNYPLILRTAEMLKPAYANLMASLGLH